MQQARRGMWVLFEDKVGILHDFKVTAKTGEVHLTDSDGLTTMVLPNVPLAALKQAHWDRMPIKRRGPRAQAARLGYIDQPGDESILTMLGRTIMKVFRGPQ